MHPLQGLLAINGSNFHILLSYTKDLNEYEGTHRFEGQILSGPINLLVMDLINQRLNHDPV